MTNKNFISILAEKAGLTEEITTQIMTGLTDKILEEALSGQVVSIQGFGNFEVKTKEERKMFNPTTNTFRTIPYSKNLTFKTGTTAKSKLNQ